MVTLGEWSASPGGALRAINITRSKALDLLNGLLICKLLEYSGTFHGLIMVSIIFSLVTGTAKDIHRVGSLLLTLVLIV
jgi:hypothetical protein